MSRRTSDRRRNQPANRLMNEPANQPSTTTAAWTSRAASPEDWQAAPGPARRRAEEHQARRPDVLLRTPRRTRPADRSTPSRPVSSATRAGRRTCGCTGCSPAGPPWSARRSPQHVTPESFADGRLVVRTDSTAWATQMKLLAGNLVHRLNQELGDGTVEVIDVLGPHTPRWTSGALPGQGSRTPRHLRLTRDPWGSATASNDEPDVQGLVCTPETGLETPSGASEGRISTKSTPRSVAAPVICGP